MRARVALAYASLMIVLYGFLYLGTALFWAAYAIDGIFKEMVGSLHAQSALRLCILVIITGIFSAIYTYMGGLRAVVRTDIVQFGLLVLGGMITLTTAIRHLGGWSNLYDVTGHLMHLHLPTDHPTLPWIGIFGMFLLDLNYWGANQVILQRALAAKNLRNAQIGLLVGVVLKYLMVLIIIIPGIALVGIMRDRPLGDPDQAYLTLLRQFLPAGIRGLILCGLFASLMSTLDSIYNSVATLWSVDIYKRHLRPQASEAQVVRVGKLAIVGAFITGISFGFVVVYVKFGNPGFPLTHWFNEMSYFVKNGFVLLVLSAVFLLRPSKNLVLGTLLLTVPATYLLKVWFPEMNYFVRSGWVISCAYLTVAIPTVIRSGWRVPVQDVFASSDRTVTRYGLALAISLLACHIVFH